MFHLIKYFFSGIIFLPFLSFSQQARIDSLEKVLGVSKDDTNKVNLLNTLCNELARANPEQATQYGNQALKLAEKLHYEKGIGSALNRLAITDYYKGNLSEGLDRLLKALKVYDKIGYKKGMASAENMIGSIYGAKADFDKAIEHYTNALNLFEMTNYKQGMGSCLNNISLMHFFKKDYTHTVENYFKAIKIFEEINDKTNIAIGYNNIGNAYSAMAKDDSALIYYTKSLKMKNESGDKFGMIESHYSLGKMHFKRKNISESKKHLYHAISLSKEIKEKAHLAEAYDFLAKCDSAERNFLDAYIHSQQYARLKDSLMNEENLKAIAEMQSKYDFEKKETIMKAEQDKKDALAKQEQELRDYRQFVIEIICVIIFVSLISISFVLYKRYKAKQKANKEITAQKKIIEEKNKDITDSITYAKRIQEAIFPDKEIKYCLFTDGFVLFQPRDIVSGDFYWFAEKNDRRLIAAVDCTGHGVPGAFMSMIGISFLNEIVIERGIINPAEILSELRHMVIRSLKQTGADGDAKDGMDIALLSFDDKNSTVEYAGANNPLWIYRKENGKINLQEYKADKRPIGFFRGQGLPFTNHTIKIYKGDSLYIFSDGYADQFGGPRGKKLKYKNLQEKLFSIQDEKMLKQEEMLLSYFNKWKGNLEQVDDVLLIGIKS